jgi:DNA-binding NtrC family response regulator
VTSEKLLIMNADESLKAKTILIVDDEEFLRDSLSEVLSLYDYQVYSCESGQAAIQFMQSHTDIDVILSDMRMPNGDGIFLLTELRKLGSQVPLLIMSGFSEVTNDEVVKRGGLGIIPKPLDMKTLRNYIG